MLQGNSRPLIKWTFKEEEGWSNFLLETDIKETWLEVSFQEHVDNGSELCRVLEDSMVDAYQVIHEMHGK